MALIFLLLSITADKWREIIFHQLWQGLNRTLFLFRSTSFPSANLDFISLWVSLQVMPVLYYEVSNQWFAAPAVSLFIQKWRRNITANTEVDSCDTCEYLGTRFSNHKSTESEPQLMCQKKKVFYFEEMHCGWWSVWVGQMLLFLTTCSVLFLPFVTVSIIVIVAHCNPFAKSV